MRRAAETFALGSVLWMWLHAKLSESTLDEVAPVVVWMLAGAAGYLAALGFRATRTLGSEREAFELAALAAGADLLYVLRRAVHSSAGVLVLIGLGGFAFGHVVARLLGPPRGLSPEELEQRRCIGLVLLRDCIPSAVAALLGGFPGCLVGLYAALRLWGLAPVGSDILALVWLLGWLVAGFGLGWCVAMAVLDRLFRNRAERWAGRWWGNGGG